MSEMLRHFVQFSGERETETFHHLKSIYYLLALLVKRDRGREGRGQEEGVGAKRERERGRERWMYQTAAPC